MVILGIADGPHASAAVVKDDRLVAAVEEERVADAPEPFPWSAAARALELAEVAPSEVRTVALCGRYTPPLQVRRHPELWKLARDPFSPALVAGTALQRLLRDTGIGAASADRATDWAREVLATRGYRPGRVQLVDVHKCAANAAYRSQKVDRVRVLVAQPRGDGALASVHDAVAGQLDRVFVDRGSQNAHVAVDRGLAVLGLSTLEELRAVARGHVPDDGLVSELGAVLAFGIAFRSRRRPERRALPPWSLLAEVDRPVAAASLLERLRRCLLGFVEQHLPAKGRPVVLAGTWLDDPALAVRAAEELGASVQLASWVGTRSLAVGAAATSAGLPPRTVSPDLGSAVPSGGNEGERVTLSAEAEVLAAGGALLRVVGREAAGALALRGRAVLVRADDPAAVDRVRQRLEVPDTVAPVRITRTRPDVSERVAGWELGVDDGTGAVIGPAGHRSLQALLDELRGASVDTLLAFPAARRGRPPARTRSDFEELFREARLEAMRLDDRLMLRSAR